MPWTDADRYSRHNVPVGWQAARSAQNVVPDQADCAASSPSDDDHPSGPAVSIAEVTFSGSLEMPITDQDQIAASVKQRTSGNSLNEVTNEAVERVEAEWQNRGYFRVQVGGGDAKTLISSPVNQRIALSVHVDEGPQFRLGGITDLDALRHLSQSTTAISSAVKRSGRDWRISAEPTESWATSTLPLFEYQY